LAQSLVGIIQKTFDKVICKFQSDNEQRFGKKRKELLKLNKIEQIFIQSRYLLNRKDKWSG